MYYVQLLAATLAPFSMQVRGIPFQTEAVLRASGYSKTPDALLGVPIGVLRRNGTAAVVNWIDSKATLGEPTTFAKEHLEQVQSSLSGSPGSQCKIH